MPRYTVHYKPEVRFDAGANGETLRVRRYDVIEADDISISDQGYVLFQTSHYNGDYTDWTTQTIIDLDEVRRVVSDELEVNTHEEEEEIENPRPMDDVMQMTRNRRHVWQTGG